MVGPPGVGMPRRSNSAAIWSSDIRARSSAASRSVSGETRVYLFMWATVSARRLDEDDAVPAGE